jgi:predicted SAM-dependent methyltransferase
MIRRGPAICVRWITTQYRRRVQARRYVRRLLRTDDDIHLEIGAGSKRLAWYTLDMNLECDLCWDLREGIPFPNNSVGCIYSSHLLEHFSHSELDCLLKDSARVLRPGGTFSVCVPNAKVYISAYVADSVLDERRFLGYQPAYYGEARIDYVNYIAYMDGCHRYMFDEENLLGMLRKAGFRKCRLREFDPSIDSEARRIGSIYAIAEKAAP